MANSGGGGAVVTAEGPAQSGDGGASQGGQVDPPVPPDPTGPGELKSASRVAILAASDIAQALSASGATGAFSPAYPVAAHRLLIRT